MINCLQQSLCKNPTLLASSSSFFPRAPRPNHFGIRTNYHVNLSFNTSRNDGRRRKRRVTVGGLLFLVDPWAPTIDSQSIASQLFASSLFPYIGFLYFITKSKSAPKLTLFGFYFLLAFVGATIPAGIYAKVHYGTSLSNVDWLHGGAESLLTLTNLFIVIGLRQALRKADKEEKTKPDVVAEIKDQKTPFP